MAEKLWNILNRIHVEDNLGNLVFKQGLLIGQKRTTFLPDDSLKKKNDFVLYTFPFNMSLSLLCYEILVRGVKVLSCTFN